MDNYATMFTKYHWVGGALGMTIYSLGSVVYFSKNKPEVEKVVKGRLL